MKKRMDNIAEASVQPRARDTEPIVEVTNLHVTVQGKPILRGINANFYPNQIFGIIGPSGAGKSTFLRCLNRLIDLTPELQVHGDVSYRGKSTRLINPDELRARVGMLFQQPVVFPRSIYENVIFGLRHIRRLSRSELREAAERALGEAALWNEVRDRLNKPALTLSVGQQQRLCLARVLATDPEVILMDEPTSALDPKTTQAIEELILKLKEKRTIVIVTHNIGQARRVTDWLACICVRDGAGEIAESACCDAVLEDPQCQEVVEYLSRELTVV